ncbi:hypothetical protein JTE90_000719 [Oedothorax gibbosus]|uniref:Monocarboxylate transporter n=1 Tax=Oedothorax gibbosus TaxID=931172 RepID=A0AAV6UNP8_9ARAC|nr:hypothetical protein JTE90_000719 [Oedothorax gibbosus]
MTDSSKHYVPSVVGVYVFVFCLLEGLQRVSGILFLFAMELLQLSRVQASFPFLVSRTTANLTGVLLQVCDGPRRSRRTWICWGLFAASAGVCLCFLNNQMVWMTVFWGIVFGAGIGISVPLLITELTKENKQSKMSALFPASPSFGCVVLPFLLTSSISKYGLNGCFLILAGIILNCIPLICIATCKLRFRLPKPKWRLRKKSKLYQMSEKQNGIDNVAFYKPKGPQDFYNDSFLENLEPDALQKVSGSDKYSTTKSEFIDILQPIIDAKRKMSTTVEDKLSHKSDSYKLDNNLTNNLSDILSDIQKYEKNQKPFEESFSHMNVVSEDSDNSIESINANKTESFSNESDSTNSSIESSEKIQVDCSDNEKAERNPKQSLPTVNAVSNATFHVNKSMPVQINPKWNNIPVQIKVHVVECTITTNAEFFEKSFEKNISPGKKASRRHSNSLISDCYDNIDFNQLLLNDKATSLQRRQLNTASKMFLITEEDETEYERKQASFRNDDIEAQKMSNRKSCKPNKTIKKFQKLINPLSMAVLYAFVTYELTLAVLLTMFADFAKDTRDDSMSSNWVLVSFGIGGFIGHLSFTHWGNRIMADGSHASAAIIFMLNGLTVAGILWSANICWMCGFYLTLGFVESGILLILPRLVMDYIEEKNIVLLSSTCKCISGICILFLPFAIGMSRDATDDYDSLLQVTSCMSVVCALLCYFLPKLRKKGNVIMK